MAAPATNIDVVRLVRRSKLVDEAKLDAYLRRWDDAGGLPAEPKIMAGALVRDGLLTYFQAEQILLGKYRGFTLGKHRILERLGYGGMGQVFLCEHMFMRRRVAIKVLPPAKARDEVALARFYREARATAALDHPNIIRSHDVDHEGDLHFLVMEFVDGVSLTKLVKKFGPLDVSRACDYVRQAALGLQHAHDAGLVHRDMKPGNLMVDRDGTVKILDLGLARFKDESSEQGHATSDNDMLLGTVDYVAPEQTVNNKVDARADIYALGGTLYFLLTGRPPFPEGSDNDKLHAHQSKVPPPLRELREVPGELSDLVARMLAKRPADRPQACGAVAAALAPFCTEVVLPPAPWELPRLSPAAMGPAEPGRVPAAAQPFSVDLDPGSGSGSLSQFNLPASATGSRSSQHPEGRRSRASRGDTRPRADGREETVSSRTRIRPHEDPNPPLRWLVIVAAASALGACLGILLWSRITG
ncbi:MAG: serine/threonine protein kinase [Gemmataceae bacterium]|nr:serine/threonine protein kinase [Gemmataceae bacterium]